MEFHKLLLKKRQFLVKLKQNNNRFNYTHLYYNTERDSYLPPVPKPHTFIQTHTEELFIYLYIKKHNKI